MRGAPDPSTSVNHILGIIPADAGSTARRATLSFLSKDHPRGCGEHNDLGQMEVFAGGSSPRMRGALTGQHIIVFPGRIIPADAGSTRRAGRWRRRAGDHPRGCGEHRPYDDVPRLTGGSSPRMRGARRQIINGLGNGRIIPADAGSTAYLSG